ncbi:major facilitator superfamily member protein [Babesia ovata]|uniref:Major facilitator superfamily member protein n=1 Tax=Babesia ovata TaxID=189622 RepID=A0A2H6K9T8_9APIC|nr:major facilitator superfamily member protein [Babesia ovata]GBE59756.1 major facilitator superfamily member protein [Babesia ovata]
MAAAGAAPAAASKTKKLEYDALGKALYYLVSFIEGYDQQVLSMCMRAFELTLGFSQSQLSTLATVSTMSRMGCCIIWGLLGDEHDSNHVLAAGLLLMGIVSICLSSASHYKVILFLRFLHGFGFACVYPVQQKIVAESTSSEENKTQEAVETTAPQTPTTSGGGQKRKKKKSNSIFTHLQALNCIGRLLCAVITTIIARKVLLGYYGWRTSYVIIGYVWILFGVGIEFGMKLRECTSSDGESSSAQIVAPKETKLHDSLAGAAHAVFTRPTALISIFTLFIAEAPMCAFNYMTIYLQYLGVSDTMAGVAIAITLIGGAAGSGAGGYIIEKIADIKDGYGELGSGIAVMVVRLVVSLLFFLGKPPCGKLLWYHYVELATLGGTLVTVGGVDRAVMKEVIEDKYQGTASAMVRTISGITSSVILFQVSAYLTEKVFGYVPSRESFETMDTIVKEQNAEALRKSMMYIIMAGTALNTICYISMFFKYTEDKEDANKGNTGQDASATQAQQ